jgi:hypothetical protein
MARAHVAAKKEESAGPIFVITRTDDGFRVHSPADPTQSYLVTGGADNARCTCPAFAFLEDSPDPRCEHIKLVFGPRAGAAREAAELPKPETPPETAAAKPTNSELDEPTNGHGATMLLKRSVSPDGRIDSLSVEFSFPVGKGSTKDIKLRATRTLKLQGEIVAGFLSQNGRKEPEHPADHEEHGNGNGNGAHNGAEPARMLEIGGINTKWGRRLFIAFQVNGDTLKLFGNRKRLGDALVAIGRPKLADQIEEGLKIDAPCLVTTKESGQYTNVDEVFPAETPTAPRGRR